MWRALNFNGPGGPLCSLHQVSTTITPFPLPSLFKFLSFDNQAHIFQHHFNLILSLCMDNEQSEEYWRKNGEDWPPSSGLENSRVPLQPVRFPPYNILLHSYVPLHRPQSGNYRDVDNQHEETHPHHTDEHGRKPNTSSALDPNSSTTGSLEQNITHSYGPVRAGYECVKGSITHRQRDGTYGNAGARESVGMYGNECESLK